VQQLLAQSVRWEGLRRPEDELRCVEEAFHLALAVGLPDVIRQIEPTRERVRSKILSEQSISNYRLAVLVNPDDVVNSVFSLCCCGPTPPSKIKGSRDRLSFLVEKIAASQR
jgi:hypothetical protein